MSMGQLLIAEVEAGRLNYIQGYIDDGAPLNDKDSKGMTALMYAARNNDSDMVELLLKAGADPLPRDDVGDDALTGSLTQREVHLQHSGKSVVSSSVSAQGCPPMDGWDSVWLSRSPYV